MTPIEKNVVVVDENGNEYEATYPKRARGLVKNGRARFIDEHTICLACPPKNDLEETKMGIPEIPASQISVQYCLEQLEAIRKDSEYILKAVESINAITVNGPGDIGAQGKANALAQMVKCREETNRRLIDFYTKAIEAQTNVKDTFALDVISVLTDSDAINEDNVSDVLETLRYIR